MTGMGVQSKMGWVYDGQENRHSRRQREMKGDGDIPRLRPMFAVTELVQGGSGPAVAAVCSGIDT